IDVELELARETDSFLPIFRSTETGKRWSLNDLWLQIQEATDPFKGIIKGQDPTIRTACFPYAGDVTVDTPGGSKEIGDVLLSLALWIEVEIVDLATAKKVEYASRQSPEIQRVEFSSGDPAAKDWRISLQIPKDATDGI